MCAAQKRKCYYDPEDLCGEEWELNDKEIAALNLQGAASQMEVEGELPDMNAEEMAKEGFYLVKSVIRHHYREGIGFPTYLPTTGEGWPKAMRHEHACLLYGQNLDYDCHCPPKP